MLTEIDKDFFCSANRYNNRFCNNGGHTYTLCSEKCACYHRKYPTPEQFKEEYGEEYPNDGTVYYLDTDLQSYGENGEQPYWDNMSYEVLQEQCGREINKEIIVCACTPFGCPPQDWRPQ